MLSSLFDFFSIIVTVFIGVFTIGVRSLIKCTFNSIAILIFSLLWLSIFLPSTTFHASTFVTLNIIAIVAITGKKVWDGCDRAGRVEESGMSGLEKDWWGRVGWFLVKWWNCISFTFLCIYKKHYHHNYLCHHSLRYRCFLFRSGPEIVSKLPSIPSQHFYFCYFDCQSSPHPLYFVQLPLWRWKMSPLPLFYSLYYLTVTIFFDRGLWFHGNVLFCHSDYQYSPPSTTFYSSSFVKIIIIGIATTWAIISTKLVLKLAINIVLSHLRG